jgi:NAD(P)H-dependent flavin oxidoreductase YrpB (nitropropane dioxygenase family)
MAEFIFMLTHHDATVEDAVAVYDGLRGTALRHVGFKDVGATKATLTELTRRMHEDGRTVYLEVVSVSAEDELRSVRTAREIGVDVVMGGTHVDAALPLLEGSGIRYFPFPGRIVGHPSVLEGSVDEIAASAAALTAHEGVHGLDLLAYRHADPVEPIIDAVVRASAGPVVIAGSIDSAERIAAVTRLGAWGFTIGGAVFEFALPAGHTLQAQVEWVLDAAARAAEDATGGSSR